jgi:hypothetical protein
LDNLEVHPTPDERNRAVRIAKDLRADPLATGIQSDREWLMISSKAGWMSSPGSGATGNWSMQ